MAGSRKESLPLPHAGLHAGSRVYSYDGQLTSVVYAYFVEFTVKQVDLPAPCSSAKPTQSGSCSQARAQRTTGSPTEISSFATAVDSQAKRFPLTARAGNRRFGLVLSTLPPKQKTHTKWISYGKH